MASYRIRTGDTLSQIAARYGVSVSSLMKANPQVRNANRIYAGASLNIPGKADDFHSRPRPPSPPAGHVPTQTSSAAFALAEQYLGWNARDLKVSGSAVGRAMEDWVPNNVNCANFVSGVLIASGQLPAKQGSAAVVGLQNNLDSNPHFRRVSLANAQPGDVVSMQTNGGHHVVFFAGWKNGRPLFVGSNNVNPDGSQRISYSQMRYPILSIHHYGG